MSAETLTSLRVIHVLTLVESRQPAGGGGECEMVPESIRELNEIPAGFCNAMWWETTQEAVLRTSSLQLAASDCAVRVMLGSWVSRGSPCHAARV